MYVDLLDPNDQWIARLLWQRRNDQVWMYHQFDLMAYAGRTVKLYFGAYNDGAGGVTGMYVDDVSLEVCTYP
jgi:bacillopeptidase F (M6 metalloprotease family)